MKRQVKARLEGEEVIILVAGRYNGPDHKSLGYLEEGSVVRIATGPYLEYNITHDLVRLTSSAMPAEVVAPQAIVVEQPATSYTDLMAAGLTERQAKALYEAGFTGPVAIKRSFGVFGLNEIAAVKGISEAKARDLLKWAGVNIPEE